MSRSVLVILCALGAVSSLPIPQEDKLGMERSLEKRICFRYQEKQSAEANPQEKSDEWLIIRLGKSIPKALNYRILTIGDRSEQKDSQAKLINSNVKEEGLLASLQHKTSTEQSVDGKLTPASSGSEEIEVISSMDANCSSSSESNVTDDKIVISVSCNSSMEAKYSKEPSAASPQASSSSNPYTKDSNNTKHRINSNNSDSYSQNSSNLTEKNFVHPEIVTNKYGKVIDVLSIEDDSSSTTEELFPPIRPEDPESEKAAQNSHRSSNEGYKSMKTNQSVENLTNSRTRESTVNTTSVTKATTENANPNTFPYDIVTNGYGVVVDVLSEEEYNGPPIRSRESSVNATDAPNSGNLAWNSTVNGTSPPKVAMNEIGNDSDPEMKVWDSTINRTLPSGSAKIKNIDASNSNKTWNSTANSTLLPGIAVVENGNASNSNIKTWDAPVNNTTLPPRIAMIETGNASNSNVKTWNSTLNSTLPVGVVVIENGNGSNSNIKTWNSTVNSSLLPSAAMTGNGNTSNFNFESKNSTVNSTLTPGMGMTDKGNISNSNTKTWNSAANSTTSPGITMDENVNPNLKILNSTNDSILPPEVVVDGNGVVIGVLSEEDSGATSSVTVDTETPPCSTNDQHRSSTKDEDNDQSTMSTPMTTMSSSDQIGNRIGDVTDFLIETVSLTTDSALRDDNGTANRSEIEQTDPEMFSGSTTEVDSKSQKTTNSATPVMSTTTAFEAVTENGFTSELGSTTEPSGIDSTTKVQGAQTFSTRELTTTTKSPEDTEGQQLTTTTTQPAEDNFRLEPSTAETYSIVGVSTSQPAGSTIEEIIQTQIPMSSSPSTATPAADSIVTPLTADGHLTLEPSQRLLPIPTVQKTLQDWEHFNNFTIIFPTRRTYYMRPDHYNPYEQGFYYMPMDPRYVQPRVFIPPL